MSVSLLNCNNYIRNFPSDVPVKAAEGCIASVAITLVAGGGGRLALLGGAMSATATLIGGIIQPILRAVFPQRPKIMGVFLVVIPQSITFLLAVSAAPWIGISYKATSVVLTVLAFNILNINDFNFSRNVALAQVF